MHSTLSIPNCVLFVVNEHYSPDSITNRQYDALQIVDGSTFKPIDAIGVGRNPTAVVIDSSTDNVYIAEMGSQSIAVYSISQGKIMRNIPVPGSPFSLSMHPTKSMLYALLLDANLMVGINTVTWQIEVSLPTGNLPQAIGPFIFPMQW